MTIAGKYDRLVNRLEGDGWQASLTVPGRFTKTVPTRCSCLKQRELTIALKVGLPWPTVFHLELEAACDCGGLLLKTGAIEAFGDTAISEYVAKLVAAWEGYVSCQAKEVVEPTAYKDNFSCWSTLEGMVASLRWDEGRLMARHVLQDGSLSQWTEVPEASETNAIDRLESWLQGLAELTKERTKPGESRSDYWKGKLSSYELVLSELQRIRQ